MKYFQSSYFSENRLFFINNIFVSNARLELYSRVLNTRRGGGRLLVFAFFSTWTQYSKYKECFTMMMLTCIKQYLSNIWSSFHENLSKIGSVEKKRCFKKCMYSHLSLPETVTHSCSVKMLFWKILEISQEKTCVRVLM